MSSNQEGKIVGRIYRLVSNNTDKIYIGSTILSLKNRLRIHESEYRRFLSNKIHRNVTSYEIINKNDYRIELIKEIPCSSRRELRKEENEVIKHYNDICINKNASYIPDMKKYQQEYHRIYQKSYRQRKLKN